MARGNSDSIGRLIARELRSGNRLKDCGTCGATLARERGRIFCPACTRSNLQAEQGAK